MFHLLNLNCSLKICPIEVHYVYVAQKLRELEGSNYCNFFNKGQPITQPIFDLHQCSVPQKNKFLMQIYH